MGYEVKSNSYKVPVEECPPTTSCPVDIDQGRIIGMHQKFEDINTKIAYLNSSLQGIVFICSTKEECEKLELGYPPKTVFEVCDASIAENLCHIDHMLDDTRILIDKIETELGIDI